MAAAKKSSKKSAAKGRKSGAKKTVKRASNGNGTHNRIAPEARLTLVENPFREGSTRHKWAALAGKSKTAADYLSKKGDGNYLSWLVRHGHVKAVGGAKAVA